MRARQHGWINTAERQCDAARMRGDDELLEALLQATSWTRDGDVLTLRDGAGKVLSSFGFLRPGTEPRLLLTAF